VRDLFSPKRRKMREYLYRREKGRCFYCENTVPLSQGSCDHIIPVVKGGATDKHNLVFSCKPCNFEKGAGDPFEYLCMKFLENKIGELVSEKPSSI
jgi:5-methylcytosine-specific restriction endonuclease McrA